MLTVSENSWDPDETKRGSRSPLAAKNVTEMKNVLDEFQRFALP